MNTQLDFQIIGDIDLIALVEKHLNTKGESTGKWTRFNCPFCRSARRRSSNELKKFLLVTNFSDAGGSYFVCKFCGKKGNALDWMQAARPYYSLQENLDHLKTVKRREVQPVPTATRHA